MLWRYTVQHAFQPFSAVIHNTALNKGNFSCLFRACHSTSYFQVSADTDDLSQQDYTLLNKDLCCCDLLLDSIAQTHILLQAFIITHSILKLICLLTTLTMWHFITMLNRRTSASLLRMQRYTVQYTLRTEHKLLAYSIFRVFSVSLQALKVPCRLYHVKASNVIADLITEA